MYNIWYYIFQMGFVQNKIHIAFEPHYSYNLKFVTTLPTGFQEPYNNKIENMHCE